MKRIGLKIDLAEGILLVTREDIFPNILTNFYGVVSIISTSQREEVELTTKPGSHIMQAVYT